MNRRILSLAPALALAAAPALAHVGHGATSGFESGLAHPFGGLDHLAAMAAVGVWSAATLPATRVWAAPAGFVLAMLAGAGLAFAGLALPLVETMIALSVVAFGLLLAFNVRIGAAAGAAVVAGFALFHGFAHGAEAHGGALGYMAGFTLATAAIHLGGIGIGRLATGWRPATALLGGGVAALGLAIVSGAT